MKYANDLTAEQFLELRRDLFVQQKDAAEALGVSQTTLNRWERARQPIPRMASELLRAWHLTGRPRR